MRAPTRVTKRTWSYVKNVCACVELGFHIPWNQGVTRPCDWWLANQERGLLQVKILCPVFKKKSNSNENFKLIRLRSSTLIQQPKTLLFKAQNRKVISTRVIPKKSQAESTNASPEALKHQLSNNIWNPKSWKVTSGPLIKHYGICMPQIYNLLLHSPYSFSNVCNSQQASVLCAH